MKLIDLEDMFRNLQPERRVILGFILTGVTLMWIADFYAYLILPQRIPFHFNFKRLYH